MKVSKHLLLGFFISCFAISGNAQITKGSILLGGDSKLDFSMANSMIGLNGISGESVDIDFSPQIGFFVFNNFALGLSIPISYGSYKPDNTMVLSSESTSISLVPFFRYYMGKGKIKPYLQGGIGLGNLKTTYTNPLEALYESNGLLILYDIETGIGIFLNEKVSLDFSFGYNYTAYSSDESHTVNISRKIAGGIGVLVIL